LSDRAFPWWRRKAALFCPCSFLVILSLLADTSALAQDVPKGEAAFTDYVAAQLRHETGATVEVKGPLTLALGKMQANLGRIFAFCNSNPEGCPREVSTYVKSAAEVYTKQNTPPSKEAIRLAVRTQAYVRSSQAALPKGAPVFQPRPLAGGLVILPVIDTPRAIGMVNEKHMQALGLSADEVFKIGLANLSKKLKPLMEVAKVVKSGQIGYFSGDVYNSSRLVLLESWSPLAKAQGGKLIVAVPATDTVLYIGDDTPIAIDALRALTKNALAGAPNPLSSELLRWTPKQWEVVR
jgi:uncharacterized protein YtpQ (UPF0354 family)